MSKQILIPGSLPGSWVTLYGTKHDDNTVLESIDVVNGAASVTTTGASGPAKDRIQTLSAVTTRQRMTWPAGTGPKHIIVSCNHADFLKFCFNAPSVATADAWLAQAYDGTFNVQHKTINNASAEEEREFVFSEPLETLDFLPTTNHTQFKVLGV